MVYCFDIDGTLCSITQSNYHEATPYPDVIARINELYFAGHTIYIYTARGGTSGLDWQETTEQQLRAWNVKHHKLFMDKPSADVFIDDKSMHINDFMNRMTAPKPLIDGPSGLS